MAYDDQNGLCVHEGSSGGVVRVQEAWSRYRRHSQGTGGVVRVQEGSSGRRRGQDSGGVVRVQEVSETTVCPDRTCKCLYQKGHFSCYRHSMLLASCLPPSFLVLNDATQTEVKQLSKHNHDIVAIFMLEAQTLYLNANINIVFQIHIINLLINLQNNLQN